MVLLLLGWSLVYRSDDSRDPSFAEQSLVLNQITTIMIIDGGIDALVGGPDGKNMMRKSVMVLWYYSV